MYSNLVARELMKEFTVEQLVSVITDTVKRKVGADKTSSVKSLTFITKSGK